MSAWILNFKLQHLLLNMELFDIFCFVLLRLRRWSPIHAYFRLYARLGGQVKHVSAQLRGTWPCPSCERESCLIWVGLSSSCGHRFDLSTVEREEEPHRFITQTRHLCQISYSRQPSLKPSETTTAWVVRLYPAANRWRVCLPAHYCIVRTTAVNASMKELDQNSDIWIGRRRQ